MGSSLLWRVSKIGLDLGIRVSNVIIMICVATVLKMIILGLIRSIKKNIACF